jgi:predicted house-cleaning NTP pyrophosphatase (Maf/HAM1 superfamily)
MPTAIDPALGKAPLVVSFSESTVVEFDSLSDATVKAYVETGAWIGGKRGMGPGSNQ